MKYHIEQSGGKSAYMQLYEQLRKDIVSGSYTYGAKLPSKRLLAEEAGVSVVTAKHAYEILCDEGYLESRQRSGYFVVYRERDFLSPAERQVKEVPSQSESGRDEFFHGESGIGEESMEESANYRRHFHNVHSTKSEFPFSVLSKTMRKVLLDYGEEILEKSPNRGCMELRNAICTYLKRSSGIIAAPEQIIIGAGAEYLYGLIIQLLGKERIFAMEKPAYEKIHKVYEANGVMCDRLKLGKDGIKSEELKQTQATVLHVTPYNSFPSGITASVSKRHEYLRWAESRGGYIIEDNYDSELTVSSKNEDTIFSMAEKDFVVYLNTFSRTVAPSFRVGYMVLPERLVEIFDQKLGFYSCTVPVFEQYVLAELIESGDFERHINRVRRARRKNSKKV